MLLVCGEASSPEPLLGRQALPVCLQRPKLIVCMLHAVLTLTAADVHSQVLRMPKFHCNESVKFA